MKTRVFYRLASSDFSFSENELYDLERQLRLDGLLKSGRPGPGGGTPATPETIAMLLIALLATDTKRGAGNVSKHYGLFQPSDGGKCGLTGASCFAEALATIIASPESAAAEHVIEAGVVRNLDVATIEYHGGDGGVLVSKFGVNAQDAPTILVKATIDGDTLRHFAAILALFQDEGQADA